MEPMTVEQLCLLLEKIDKEHNPIFCNNQKNTRKHIKYARPHIDFRSMTCFAIDFSGFGWERSFSSVNEFDVNVSLYDIINAWLDDEPIEYNQKQTVENK